MLEISNALFSAQISENGAELKSFYNKSAKAEYIWNSNPEFWGKSFPLLFPNIGFLKNNRTIINEKEYSIPKHGILRTGVFKTTKLTESSAALQFKSSFDTLKRFPFEFTADVIYTLTQKALKIEYRITNRGKSPMPYCFGLHPAFFCPAMNTGGDGDKSPAKFSDYSLIFEKPETLNSPTIQPDGTMDVARRIKIAENRREFKLCYKMFENDALTFEKINSSYVYLRGPA